MSFIIAFKEQAREDIANAAFWYETQKSGLGDQFLIELNELVNRLRVNPHLYQARRKSLRLGLVNRFPYLVVFEIEGKYVVVYKIIHSHRSNKKRYNRTKK